MIPAVRALVFAGAVMIWYQLSKQQGKFHFHKCECGNLWAHGHEMRGNKDAHLCSKCGRLQWHVLQTPVKGGVA